MIHKPVQSFSVDSPREYFNQLLLVSYESYSRDRISIYKAVSCAMFMWHLKDWLWQLETAKLNAGQKNEANSKKWVRSLYFECPELKLIEELVDCAKHTRSKTRNTIDASGVEGGYYQGLLALGTGSELVIHSKNEKNELTLIFKRVKDFWAKYLDEHKID